MLWKFFFCRILHYWRSCPWRKSLISLITCFKFSRCSAFRGAVDTERPVSAVTWLDQRLVDRPRGIFPSTFPTTINFSRLFGWRRTMWPKYPRILWEHIVDSRVFMRRWCSTDLVVLWVRLFVMEVNLLQSTWLKSRLYSCHWVVKSNNTDTRIQSLILGTRACNH